MHCSTKQDGHPALFESLESRALMSATLTSASAPAAPPAVAAIDGSRTDVEGPQKLEVINTTSKTITLEWNSVKAENFVIERSLDGKNFSPVAKVAGDITQFTDVGLQSGTRYFYQVRAVVNGNVSDPSPIADGTTISIGVPRNAKDPSVGIPTL
jgi:hypothetical protein